MNTMLKITNTLALAVLIAASAEVAAADTYGAIAYSPSSGVYKIVRTAISRRNAEERALKGCQEQGPGCRSAIWFRNACASLAVGPKGWGSHWGVSIAEAKHRALTMCSRVSPDCKIIDTQCAR